MGSGGAELIVYFGLEASGEASPRRAARAALEIRDQCARRSSLIRTKAGWNVDVRFGLHQGMVTVDALVANDVSTLNATVMIASRLCQLATPGDIAVSQTAVGLLLGLRRFDPQEPDPALGTLPWYRLSSELADTPAAVAAEEVAPLTIGRASELELLESVWRAGAGFSVRCVVVSGPPGIGKTHLATLWHRRLAAKGCEVLQGRCLPETQGSALHPILQLVRNRLGLDEEEPSRAVSVLDRFLSEEGLGEPANLSLLSEWFGLPQGALPDLQLSPKKKRDQFLVLMTKVVSRLTPAPLVVFLDDVQWADPTTLEWMRMLVEGGEDGFPLLSCTLRSGPSGHPGDTPSPRNQQNADLAALLASPRTLPVELPPLTDESARELLAQVWASNADMTLLLERGAGVPLFLLELVRCGVATRDFVVPPSIAELLRMRIDQLGRAKETAQLAAVIGPEFDSALITDLSQRGSELLGDLNHLQNAGIIALTADGHYAFAHSLLYESAYQSLPRKDRRRLHEGVALFLAARHPELQTTKPWLFATHYHRAAQPMQALAFGEAAAGEALMRFHNFETLGYVRELKGSSVEGTGGWLRDIEDEAERARLELRLLALEATALMLTRGWSDPELSRTCHRATQLFSRVPAAETLQMRYVLAQFYFSSGWAAGGSTGKDERARPWIDSLIDAAASSGSVVFRSLGMMMLAAWQLFHGELGASIETARGVERFPEARDAWKYGYDAVLCARSVESQARWLAGVPHADAFTAETLRLAQEFGHPATLANVQLYSLTQLHLSGDRAGTLERCAELCALCEKAGIQGFPAYAMIFKGWAEGNPAMARGAYEALIGAGQRLCEVYCCTIAAEAELDAGNQAAAVELLETAAARAIATGESFILPHILSLQARVVRESDAGESERLFTRAIQIAGAQGANGLVATLKASRAHRGSARCGA